MKQFLESSYFYNLISSNVSLPISSKSRHEVQWSYFHEFAGVDSKPGMHGLLNLFQSKIYYQLIV